MELGIFKLLYHTSMVLDTCKLKYDSIHTRETYPSYYCSTTYVNNANKYDSVTNLKWMHVFEWYMVRCGSTNRHQKDMC